MLTLTQPQETSRAGLKMIRKKKVTTFPMQKVINFPVHEAKSSKVSSGLHVY